jgi:hypothetical protein
MTPVETLALATFLATAYPSVRVRGEPAPRTWHARLADLDPTDALIAVIGLARGHRDIALGDVYTEAHRMREERLIRHPQPDADSDGPRALRTTLLPALTAMLSLRVPCPWCGAARGQPCALPGRDAPSRISAHPARLIAVGVAGSDNRPRGTQHVR